MPLTTREPFTQTSFEVLAHNPVVPPGPWSKVTQGSGVRRCLPDFISLYSKMETVSDPNEAEARPRPGQRAAQQLEVSLWMHFSSRPPPKPTPETSAGTTLLTASRGRRRGAHRSPGSGSISGAMTRMDTDGHIYTSAACEEHTFVFGTNVSPDKQN
ncbi:Hypothetical predicted protein [Xyrichtys novacula]|uniref:Uncharacterized protein n=1 Tax=Xyrichtys novacula TaxID=13765 RepID=A0AAV1H9E4_XYRNO|nr:Hypothetical predicted protein [Xyrichtys novacula]